jgi:thiol-disulfide isomerase/thioredoxin
MLNRKGLIIILLPLIFTVAGRSQEVKVMDFNQLAPLLEQKNDTVYMINFWATWCLPCVEEMPDILKFAQDKKNTRFKLILVSLDMPGQIDSRVKPFLKRFGIRDRIILLDDPDANKWIDRVSPQWTGAIPATLFYSRDFRQFHGDVLDYKTIQDIVEPRLRK